MSERKRDGFEDDPSEIFARLREIEIPPALLASVSDGVTAALDGEAREAPRRSWMRPTAAWAAAAALAAAALLVPAWREPAPTPATQAVATPRAGITSLRTPGPAQVLDLTVGDTQVVMIFDAELKL